MLETVTKGVAESSQRVSESASSLPERLITPRCAVRIRVSEAID